MGSTDDDMVDADAVLAVGLAEACSPLDRGAQVAKAARWRGRHPCRVSRCDAASGYSRMRMRMNRHAATYGSSALANAGGGTAPADRSLKHA